MNTIPAIDTPMNRYYILANMQNIENMARYSFEWTVLADDFAVCGRPAMAGMCYARAKQYGELAGGEFIRLFEMPFSELIRVDA